MKLNQLYKNSLGIALMIVLSGLILVSAIVTEFAYQAQVDYYSAANYRNRLQAYQLALSGTEFGQLILKYDKDVQQIIKKSGKDVYVPPLYDLIPVDTSILRTMAVAEDIIGADQATNDEVENSEEESTYKAINLEGVESFLDFKGDFSVEIEEEESKLNLNAFYSLSPKDARYDRLKKTLYFLLLDKEFSEIFEDPYRGSRELTQNIVDYIDRDQVYNEEEGQERGREGTNADQNYEMKNAKLISLEELILVPGMNDQVLQKLKPYLTVYGKDDRIFACRARPALVRAMVLSYTQNNPRMEPLNETNQDLLEKATDAVIDNCPDVKLAAQELDVVLNVDATDSSRGSPFAALPDSKQQNNGNSNNTRRRGGSNRQSQTNTFLDLVAIERNVYNIKSTGRVDETEVTVNVVWDTSAGNPQQWNKLMWKSY